MEIQPGHHSFSPFPPCKSPLERDRVALPGENLLLASGQDAGQSVLHLHLHVVPRHAGDGLDMNPWWQERMQRPKPQRDALERVAQLLRSNLPEELAPR
jgi:diadenosine tetraphosphate (Ap4A) HIT family hydrolase